METEKGAKIYLECEKHWCFWSLILVGGFYGAYTFCVRGGIFCNAQTANIVLLAIDLGSGNRKEALYLLLPISAYFLGAMLSEILGDHIRLFKCIRWNTILVGFEIPVVIFLGFLPESAPDQICQVALNFICSMQFATFRQNEGIPMATTFVTNHIRQTGINLVKAIRDKDSEASFKCKMHGSMILMFLIGGVISAILCLRLDVRAIWGALPVLLYIFIRLCMADRREYREKIAGK